MNTRLTILENGDLEVTVDGSGKDLLADILSESGSAEAEQAVFGSHLKGGSWRLVPHENLCIRSTVLTNDWSEDGGGGMAFARTLWWFPDHAILDPMWALANNGKVTLRSAGG